MATETKGLLLSAIVLVVGIVAGHFFWPRTVTVTVQGRTVLGEDSVKGCIEKGGQFYAHGEWLNTKEGRQLFPVFTCTEPEKRETGTIF